MKNVFGINFAIISGWSVGREKTGYGSRGCGFEIVGPNTIVNKTGYLLETTCATPPTDTLSFMTLVAWFARIDSHDSREWGDSRESEIQVIRANRPDVL